ncbi:hypothetical protein [Psychrobacillus sp. FSL H8-0487]|uniref:hypothetical protein n=1 Tax=Psychrobacillus sp. FSL H8-0487 TaxID=2921391 RepID=UPI0030F8FF5E
MTAETYIKQKNDDKYAPTTEARKNDAFTKKIQDKNASLMVRIYEKDDESVGILILELFFIFVPNKLTIQLPSNSYLFRL